MYQVQNVYNIHIPATWLSNLYIIIYVSSPTLEVPELPGLGLTRKTTFLPSEVVLDQQRNKNRVSIGSAFLWWSKMKDKKGLKSHAEVATFLLDG